MNYRRDRVTLLLRCPQPAAVFRLTLPEGHRGVWRAGCLLVRHGDISSCSGPVRHRQEPGPPAGPSDNSMPRFRSARAGLVHRGVIGQVLCIPRACSPRMHDRALRWRRSCWCWRLCHRGEAHQCARRPRRSPSHPRWYAASAASRSSLVPKTLRVGLTEFRHPSLLPWSQAVWNRRTTSLGPATPAVAQAQACVAITPVADTLLSLRLAEHGLRRCGKPLNGEGSLPQSARRPPGTPGQPHNGPSILPGPAAYLGQK